MWIKLAFMCKTPWKFPVCEVRISPNFSRVLWSCSRLPLSPPAGQSVLQESWRDVSSFARRGKTRHGCALPAPAKGSGSPGWKRRAPGVWQFPWGGLVSFFEQLSIQNAVATWTAAGPSGCPDTSCQVLESPRGRTAAPSAFGCCASAARRARPAPALRAAASDSGGGGRGIVLLSFLQGSGRSLHHFQ